MTPRLSIIIPSRNDAAALSKTIEWLRGVEGIREAEVIVAASGDPTGTLQAVWGRMQILWPSGSTRSALMNAGAAVARSPILFFVHADSFPPRQALSLIEQALREEHVVGGAFEHRFAEPHRSLRVISWINRMRYRFTRNYYGDQGLFVRASTFHALGGYRDLPLLEDLDLSRRLKRAGRTAFVPAPLVTSGRRFLARGPWRTFFFIVWLLLLHSLRLGTARYAERWRGPAELPPGSLWLRGRLRTDDRGGTSWGVSETTSGGVSLRVAHPITHTPSPDTEARLCARSEMRRRISGLHRGVTPWALATLGCVLSLAGHIEAAAFRDELTFLGRTTFLLRAYALVVPVDLKRQRVQDGTFLEIKAWGAWNGKWVPYVYEPITVRGAAPEDVNDIVARYRQLRPDAGLDVRKGSDNAFFLRSDKGRSHFQLQTPGFTPRLTADNPEGRILLGLSEGTLTVNGQGVSGRVVSVHVKPMSHSDASGRYGLYDHFTLQLSSGAVLVVYHSRTRPGFDLAALLNAEGAADRQDRNVRVAWRKPTPDAESGRAVPTAWSVEVPELALKAELEEWGRNLVRYKTDAGQTAIVSNVMVRGSVEVGGSRLDAFGLNVHVQDE